MRTLLPIVALVAATAAAPAPDPVLHRLIADAKAMRPVPFERTQRIEDGGKVHVYVDRYDPATSSGYKLVSVDGHAPAASDSLSDWRRTTRNAPPSYSRLALLLPASKLVDTAHYHVQPLPKKFMAMNAMGEHAAVDLTIDRTGLRPFVREARFFTTEPFRIMMVVKIESFEAINRYVMDADGGLRIVAQDQTIVMSGLSPISRQEIHATFRPLGH
jgi:hypothetical protein